jgi:hypothetical protein
VDAMKLRLLKLLQGMDIVYIAKDAMRNLVRTVWQKMQSTLGTGGMIMETINDIVSEMRHDNEELKKYADRIEKAWERGAKAIATENAVLPAVCITKPVGNAAEMREALFEIHNQLKDRLARKVTYERMLFRIKNIIKAALSTPPRNCDIPSVIEGSHRAWLEDEDNWDEFGSPKKEIHEWLLAEAKGESDEQ